VSKTHNSQSEQAPEEVIVPFPGMATSGAESRIAGSTTGPAEEGLELIIRHWPMLPEEIRQAIVDAVKEEA